MCNTHAVQAGEGRLSDEANGGSGGGGAVALVVLSPVLAVLAIAVRVVLGSPVLFVQERVGRREKPFRLYKFRTMRDTRDEVGDLLPDDVRLPRFGRWLRRSSLDEVPVFLEYRQRRHEPRGSPATPCCVPDSVHGVGATPSPRPAGPDWLGTGEGSQCLGLGRPARRGRLVCRSRVARARSAHSCPYVLAGHLWPRSERAGHGDDEGASSAPGGWDLVDRIYLSPPDLRGPEREFILNLLDSNWIAPVGPDLDAFEAEVAALAGRSHGVGLSSGTAALHLALLAVGVKPGDEVLVSTFTFVASVNAVLYCGASPVFIDSDPSTWNMSPGSPGRGLDSRRRLGRAMPAAAVVVDLYGQCADFGRIEPILVEHGVPLVEDAAEAIGASHDDRPAGSFGKVAVFSFNGNKLITASGGGMLVTDDARLAARVRHLATQAREPVPHYEHREMGFNYRLSNLLAAVGRGQLCTLRERIQRRAEIGSWYAALCASVDGLQLNPIGNHQKANHWLTCLTVEPSKTHFRAEDLLLDLAGQEIEALSAVEAHAPSALILGRRSSRVDGTSEGLFGRGVCLPSGSGMTEEQLDRVVIAILSRNRAACGWRASLQGQNVSERLDCGGGSVGTCLRWDRWWNTAPRPLCPHGRAFSDPAASQMYPAHQTPFQGFRWWFGTRCASLRPRGPSMAPPSCLARAGSLVPSHWMRARWWVRIRLCSGDARLDLALEVVQWGPWTFDVAQRALNISAADCMTALRVSARVLRRWSIRAGFSRGSDGPARAVHDLRALGSPAPLEAGDPSIQADGWARCGVRGTGSSDPKIAEG